MAYSAYCDTASHTKWWIIGTGSTANRLSEVMDDNASGVEEYDNPGNYQPWSEFMTEVVEDGVYLIHQNLEIGDGSTSTTLTSKNEMVWFDDDKCWEVKASATLNIGEISSTYGMNGSYWSFKSKTGATFLLNGGTLNLAASHLHHRGGTYCRFYTGMLNIVNSQFSGEYDVSGDIDAVFWIMNDFTSANINITDLFVTNLYGFFVYNAPVTCEDIRIHKTYGGATANNAFDATIKDALITSATKDARLLTSGQTLSFVDPKQAIGTVEIKIADGVIYEQYTINIHVTDKDGNLMGTGGRPEATVLLEGSDSGSASTEYDTVVINNVDTVSGVLPEQTITAKKWVGTSVVLTNYNYFKLTISATDYETLVYENITIDKPIDWHLELQGVGPVSVDVNYYDKVVYITSPSTTVSVQQLYNAIRAKEDTIDGLSFGGPVKSVSDGFVDGEGEADLGADFKTPLTITLDSNWYIEFWNGVGLGIVNNGNVVGGKDGRPVRCAPGSSDTALVLGAERGIQVEGAGDLTDIEAMLKQIKNLFFVQGI